MITILIHWLLVALAFLMTSQLVPGFVVTNFPAALFAAAVVGLLNIILWPILVLLTLPLTVVTFGLFLFVVNALVLLFGSALTPGFHIEGFGPAILGGMVLTLIGWLVRFVFGGKKRSRQS